jgi:YYY domain-containing protein
MNTQDFLYILIWFIAFFVIGIAVLPLTFSLFKGFKDKGYIFSKIVGTIIISYLIFILGVLKLAKFSFSTILLIIIILFFINYVFLKRNNVISIIKSNFRIIIAEEALFLIALAIWSYVRSNAPDVYGLEKFMDLGFINSILRSDYFPPKDMWYAPLSINYYYFGHLVTAVITKLTQLPSFISFNLMISTIFAFTFTATFSIGMNIFCELKSKLKPKISGILTAILLTFGGNLTTIYAFFKAYSPADKPVPFWNLSFLPINFPNGFWYPNATRFIPFTIHEFPIYSFVVSDLHGHVLDIPFVLLTIALLFSIYIEKQIRLFHLLSISFLLAVMYMTNAWDGIIYLLLTILIIMSIKLLGKNWKILFTYDYLSGFFKKIFILLSGFLVFSIPFSINFKPFASGIGIICAPTLLTNIGRMGPFLFEANHCQRSPLWQLTLLYGFFYFFVIAFIVFLKFKKKYKPTTSDIFVIILIILSTILIIIPEFIYIKDIYPLHYRANTMFKLVYQAFIMLSISCGYIFVKLMLNLKNKIIVLIFLIISIFLACFILIYPYFAINSYYNNLKTYKSLNGFKYLQQTYPQDYDLINWINANIKNQPVILEANGDSYTQYARISANTGLPTIIGWPVHEWLWRGTYDIVSPRIIDVETLYTTNNLNTAKKLIKKYNVSYVAVSGLERQKYPALNEQTFIKLGKIVYQNSGAKLYKINL